MSLSIRLISSRKYNENDTNETNPTKPTTTTKSSASQIDRIIIAGVSRMGVPHMQRHLSDSMKAKVCAW